jgi:hypothetical protein
MKSEQTATTSPPVVLDVGHDPFGGYSQQGNHGTASAREGTLPRTSVVTGGTEGRQDPAGRGTSGYHAGASREVSGSDSVLAGSAGSSIAAPSATVHRRNVLIGRRLAAQISDDQIDELNREHAELVEVHFSRGLSRSERAKKARIEWELDRVEDARHGPHLDALTELAEYYRSLATEIGHLNETLSVNKPRR